MCKKTLLKILESIGSILLAISKKILESMLTLFSASKFMTDVKISFMFFVQIVLLGLTVAVLMFGCTYGPGFSVYLPRIGWFITHVTQGIYLLSWIIVPATHMNYDVIELNAADVENVRCGIARTTFTKSLSI
jgi:hypothetical protein